jgi:hypothetical protein
MYLLNGFFHEMQITNYECRNELYIKLFAQMAIDFPLVLKKYLLINGNE